MIKTIDVLDNYCVKTENNQIVETIEYDTDKCHFIFKYINKCEEIVYRLDDFLTTCVICELVDAPINKFYTYLTNNIYFGD